MSILAVRVDSNEPAQMHRLFHVDFGETYGKSKLPVADIEVLTDSGIVLFERKTGSDLLQSIKDNRLFSQAARLGESGKKSYLLVTFADYSRYCIGWRGVRAAWGVAHKRIPLQFRDGCVN